MIVIVMIIFFSPLYSSSDQDLAEFYRTYSAPVVSQGLSCVGLSFRLRDSIAEKIPALRRSLVIASCEEWVEDLDIYVAKPDPGVDTVKEHVMVAVRILCRETEQRVLVLLDSGYHVPRLIVVTSDGAWPHTGRFVQSDTAKSRKEYEFSWKNESYVHWTINETRKGRTSVSILTNLQYKKTNQLQCFDDFLTNKIHVYYVTQTWSNLIYTRSSFDSSLGYSEKRNLLYDFRTLVARDENGPCAGVYVKFNEPNWNAHFTLFYKVITSVHIPIDYQIYTDTFELSSCNNVRQNDIDHLFQNDKGERIESKFPVTSVLQEPSLMAGVAEVAHLLNTSEDKLGILLEDTAKMYLDREFIRELLHLNYAVDPFEQAKPLID